VAKLNLVKKEIPSAAEPAAEPWRILVVDDDPEVHAVTRLALRSLRFGGRGIELLHADSAIAARQMLSQTADIAIVLLDVVMETDDAGLRLARHIRDELKNSNVRIVLRTGQPGQAPEEEVIVEYDVNDYKAKTELTARKLFTTTVTALRAYEHLKHLEAHRRGLQQVAKAADALVEEGSLDHFAFRALVQLQRFVGTAAQGFLCAVRPPTPQAGPAAELQVLAATGGEPIDAEARDLVLSVAQHRSSAFVRAHTVLYLGCIGDTVFAACFRAGACAQDGPARALVELLCSKIAIGLRNAQLYDQLRASNALLEAKVEQRTSELAQANLSLQEANSELTRRALFDALTDLPNRLLFEDRLTRAVARCGRSDRGGGPSRPEKLGILFIDLDGFKPINDSFGHAVGDRVLQSVAARLRSVARASDTPARVGGDEFLLLMEDVSGPADCVAAARRMLEALAQPFDIGERDVEVTASIGIVMYPDQGASDKLIAQADAAMYEAKRAGGHTYALFEEHMGARALDELNLQHDLRHAIAREQLRLHYQPKVDHKGELTGVEALLRWQHPQRGMVSAALFIALAERFGLIDALGGWVIEEACRQTRAWADSGLQMRVAINLSVHQLRQDDLVDQIESALRRYRLAPSQLLCEITETVAMDDVTATQRTIKGLERIGVYLAIDDFGTGYSSLSCLRQLPARQLKIDRSFVNDLVSCADAAAVVKAVIQLAHGLGLHVVAEGVETAEQRDILLQLGCDQLQGYFYAKPMAADALVTWVSQLTSTALEQPVPGPAIGS
jgi:diguanylate cyclase (GGDEF)-like protein